MERPENPLSAWRKSTYSGSAGGECVEVGGGVRSVLVRDTKDRGGSVLDMGPAAWSRLVDMLKA